MQKSHLIAGLSLILCASMPAMASQDESCPLHNQVTGFVFANNIDGQCKTSCETFEASSRKACDQAARRTTDRAEQISQRLRARGCLVTEALPMFVPKCENDIRTYRQKFRALNCVAPDLAQEDHLEEVLSEEKKAAVMSKLMWGNLMENIGRECKLALSAEVLPAEGGNSAIRYIKLESSDDSCQLFFQGNVCPEGYVSKPKVVTYRGSNKGGSVLWDSQYTACKTMQYCVRR